MKLLSFIFLMSLFSCAEGTGVLNRGGGGGSGGPSLANDPSVKLNAELQVFEKSIWPELQSSCVSCHGSGSQRNFADDDQLIAYTYVVENKLFNLQNPSASRFVYRMKVDHHNCGTLCENLALKFEEAAAVWFEATKYRNLDIEIGAEYSITTNGASVVMGRARSGSVIYVEAPAMNPAGQAFLSLQGNVTFDDASRRQSFFIMPDTNVQIQAVYENKSKSDPNDLWAFIDVKNGGGDGEYRVNDRVIIESDIFSSPFIFDQWVGDVSVLADPRENPAEFFLSVQNDLAFEAKFRAGDGRASFKGSLFDLPGRIEAEDFDLGPEGLTYHDTEAANNGGAYRNSGVDVFTNSGGFQVGGIAAGEWLEYSVWVEQAGTFQTTLYLAQVRAGAQVQMSVDGVDVTGLMNVPVSGNFRVNLPLQSPSFSLQSGPHILRVNFVRATADGWVGDLDYMEFSRQ